MANTVVKMFKVTRVGMIPVSSNCLEREIAVGVVLLQLHMGS